MRKGIAQSTRLLGFSTEVLNASGLGAQGFWSLAQLGHAPCSCTRFHIEDARRTHCSAAGIYAEYSVVNLRPPHGVCDLSRRGGCGPTLTSFTRGGGLLTTMVQG